MSKIKITAWLSSVKKLEHQNDSKKSYTVYELIFLYNDKDSYKMMQTRVPGGFGMILPYDDKGFKVRCKNSVLFPEVIRAESLLVNVDISARKYSFISTGKKNSGDTITGYTLSLNSIN